MSLESRLTDLVTAVREKLNAMTTAIAGKQATIPNGTTSQYYRGDKSWQTLSKAAVGLGSVDNTSDTSKPISTATQTDLNAKLDSSSYIRGLSAYCAGKPADSEAFAGGVAPSAITLSAANSSAKAGVAATASTVFTVAKNGSSIGTISFNAAATLGTVSLTTTLIAAGDFLTIQGPSTADATLANIAFLLRS